MTTEPDTNTEVGMPTTIQPDAFGAVLALITLIGDARASAARLAELRAAVTTAEQAQANLIAARTAHDAHVAATEAEIERERKEIMAAKVKLANDQAGLDETRTTLREYSKHYDRLIGRYEQVGTLVREFVPDHPDGRGDAHERMDDQHGADNTRVERVPHAPAGLSIRRSKYRPRSRAEL